jgi:preprotein translocase subunit SecE
MKSTGKISNFFAGTASEIKKITWPTKNETINYTITVLVICIVVSVLLGLFDMLYLHILQKFVF